MLKLDIIVPVILIVCLLALAWILAEIFNTPKVVQPVDQTEIVLDPSRYTDDTAPTNGSSANVSNTPDALEDSQANSSKESSEEDAVGSQDEDRYSDGTEADDGYESPAYGDNTVTTPPTTDYVSENEKSGGNDALRSVNRDKYLVIAGSFRQEANARAQVKRLKRLGFADAEMGFTNRGAYAVALAYSTGSHLNALDNQKKLANKGIDSFVKQRK